MRPPLWHPPIALSSAEPAVAIRVRRAKLFPFLRRIRHDLFDDPFQAELATMYRDVPHGQPPVPPAQPALVTILQAYTGASDDAAIEAPVMDRRWQLVLACLDCAHAPFGKGTLVRFRAALIAHGLDRRLVERTVAMAERDGGVGPRRLRAALDSSPLWGAGRVEDTYNLLGHALRKALGVLARRQGRGRADAAAETGTTPVAGSSPKAAPDLDRDEPEARAHAPVRIVDALTAREGWPAEHPAGGDPVAPACLAIAHRVRAQDVVTAPDGAPRLRQGVAPARRISVEDGELRHGRKGRTPHGDGYKRHALRDLDRRLVRAVGVTPANAPEATVTDSTAADVARQAVVWAELHIDRACLSSRLVRARPPELAVYRTAWPVQNGPRFPTTAFTLDRAAGTIRCPQGETLPFAEGAVVHFPAATCAACPVRERCATSASGRSVTIHPDERLPDELRERQRTPAGRATRRERVAVEHSLAHVGHGQGPRARDRGVRNNPFDLRRMAVVHNLHVLKQDRDPDRQLAA